MATISLKQLPTRYADATSYSPIQFGSNTTILIAGGQYRDNTNSVDIVLPLLGVTLNQAVNGLNGLDSGTIAASTWYYIYAVGDSSGNRIGGALISTSYIAPILPYGYDVYRLIG